MQTWEEDSGFFSKGSNCAAGPLTQGSKETHMALPLQPSPSSIVVVALSGTSKGKYIVSWAIEKFGSEQNVKFKLLHIRPKITSVPTPMGNAIPIAEVRDEVVEAYRQEIEWQANERLLPYKKLCDKNKVPVDILMLESDDVATAITEEINRHRITRLIIGVSPKGFFSRRLDLCSVISSSTPSFCTVYVVSKGKLSSVKPSNSEADAVIIRDDNGSERTSSTSGSSGQHSDSHYESAGPLIALGAATKRQPMEALSKNRAISMPMETSSAGSEDSGNMSVDAEGMKDAASINRSGSDQGQAVFWTSRLRDFEERNKDVRSSCSSNGNGASWTSMMTDNHSRDSRQASNMSEGQSENSFSENQVNLNFEIEKLRSELRHVQEMYAMAQTETIDASRKLDELNQRRLEEAIRLENLKLKELEGREVAAKEKQRFEDARQEAKKVRERAEKEVLQRLEAEKKAARDAKDKEKLENALVGPVAQYQSFTWEEIVAATSGFAEEMKIGMGSYGTVYKCNMHHTTAAVKILHSVENGLSKQFHNELDILSKIRHPHLLLLLGACPEKGCLVYEYLENGSLEDRLFQLNNTSPIPWFERFRISWEIASALVFLHKTKPKPIIHRDLKPANILLDHNFVSKVGDVGLSTMIQSDVFSKFTVYKDTNPVGTLCYIDPEYQRTGMISAKSDVYSFGMVLLQILTGKPAIALTHTVEQAIDRNNEFLEILDKKAGSWPIDETRELAVLALQCTELRSKDRPSLQDQILPALERMKRVAERARNSISGVPTAPPSHFICPLLKDVMSEPCVAADGYTYDRHAIEEWLEENQTSPMTNLPLLNKSLLPNYTLYTAIMEWRSRKP